MPKDSSMKYPPIPPCNSRCHRLRRYLYGGISVYAQQRRILSGSRLLCRCHVHYQAANARAILRNRAGNQKDNQSCLKTGCFCRTYISVLQKQPALYSFLSMHILVLIGLSIFHRRKAIHLFESARKMSLAGESHSISYLSY